MGHVLPKGCPLWGTFSQKSQKNNPAVRTTSFSLLLSLPAKRTVLTALGLTFFLMTSAGDLFDMCTNQPLLLGTSANEFQGKAPRPQFISGAQADNPDDVPADQLLMYNSADDEENPDSDDDAEWEGSDGDESDGEIDRMLEFLSDEAEIGDVAYEQDPLFDEGDLPVSPLAGLGNVGIATLEAAILAVKAAAKTKPLWEKELLQFGKSLLRDSKTIRRKNGDVLALIAEVRAKMVELYVKNGKFELSVPKSQMYTNWSVHVDALPTPVGSGNLPPPSSDDWQIKAALYAIESLRGAGGKIPGHILFRRGLALSQLSPADRKGLENFDRKVVGAVATFRKRNCYQRLNQMDSDAKTDLVLNKKTDVVLAEKMELGAKRVMSAAGDLSPDFTEAKFTTALGALRHARGSPGPISEACLSSGSEAAIAAAAIAIAAVDTAAPSVWPWARLKRGAKQEALDFRLEQDESGRASKVQKMTREQVNFLVMNFVTAEPAEAPGDGAGSPQ